MPNKPNEQVEQFLNEFGSIEEDLKDYQKKFSSTFLKKIYDDASNCVGKQSQELTEDEKFGLCFVNGCEIDYIKNDDDTLSMRTKYKCDILNDSEGKFIIMEIKDND